MQMGNQPILILPEKTQRTVGRDAQRTNIMAAKVIGETVKTTLGPMGMDKMLVDSMGDIVVTNDGVTILKQIDVEHPAAKMVVEVAKTQEEAVGDGTTTAVVLAGEFLKRAEELLDQDVHPTIIAQGYRLAAKKANEILDKIAKDITIDNEDMLKKVAQTSMTGKGAEKAKVYLADLVVKAVKTISENNDGDVVIDTKHIKIEKKVGGDIEDTELIKGVLVDKSGAHSGMPKKVKNAKILLIDSPLEVQKTQVDAEIRITDPTQLKAFLDEEEKMLRDMVEQIHNVGVNVVFCQKGIDDLAQHYLAKFGILAAKLVKKPDLEKISRATGAKIINNLENLSENDLGFAGLIEEIKIGEDSMICIKECVEPKSASILVRGGTEHIVDEVERALEDCLGVVPAAINDRKILAGGGASEIEIAKGLRNYAKSVGGREQLAIEAFADAVEVIPRALAENAGLDPIDVLVELRAKHEKNGIVYGIDVNGGKPKDMYKDGVIEPLRVKKQAIDSASEVAVMILRIDDVIAATKLEGDVPPQ